MKIAIEKLNSNTAVLKVEFEDISFSEVWIEEEDGNYSISEPILNIIKRENIEIEDDLEKYLNNIDIVSFLKLCTIY